MRPFLTLFLAAVLSTAVAFGAEPEDDMHLEAIQALKAGEAVCQAHELSVTTPSLWWGGTGYEAGYAMCDRLISILNSDPERFRKLGVDYEQHKILVAIEAANHL